MNNFIRTYIIFASLLFCLTSNAQEAIVSGHWDGSWQYSDKSYTEKISLDLSQRGNEVTGTGVDQLGVKAIVSGEIIDSNLVITVSPENNTAPITFKGVMNGNSIVGTWYLDVISGPWSVTR